MGTIVNQNWQTLRPSGQLLDEHQDLMGQLNSLLLGVERYVASGVIVGPYEDTLAEGEVNTENCKVSYIECLTAGSISSIIGCLKNTPFHLVCLSGTSLGINPTDTFRIASEMIFTPNDTLSLIWDGTLFYEVGRSVNT